ncbi:HAD hydrolase-like protein [Pedobacter sp. Du54]|uniref:HAD family hydrolase n=1 Tax=Pedobacter anseongensis TaxID=3133439 RepID=UPI0030B12D45
MTILETYNAQKTAFIFGLDEVLYPEKDYLLQVYYLFAEFIEYTEQISSKEILSFMQQEYSHHGNVNIFDKTAEKFNLPTKYKSNFELLHETARLPLKLLLFQNILSLLQELVVERKEIYLLVTGKPSVQLNKIKQFEWHGLEPHLKLYFSEEQEPYLSGKSVGFIIDQNNLKKENVLYIGNSDKEEEASVTAGVEFLFVTKLL